MFGDRLKALKPDTYQVTYRAYDEFLMTFIEMKTTIDPVEDKLLYNNNESTITYDAKRVEMLDQRPKTVLRYFKKLSWLG